VPACGPGRYGAGADTGEGLGARPLLRTLEDVQVRGKRVLLREDFNVPLKNGAIADATRIDAALPTLRLLHERGAKTIVLAHLGRPDGRRDERYSLRPVAQLLRTRGFPVRFADDCVGEPARKVVAELRDGDIALLENLRFHAGEERNDPAFARLLSQLGEIYVNDAFGAAHRAHASTEGVAHLLPAVAGLLMQKEIETLTQLLRNPREPFVCAIGGAKIKDKVGVFRSLMRNVQAFCIGGGMANTFLAAYGIGVGTSLRDDDLEPAKGIAALAKGQHVPLLLPIDAVVSTSFQNDAGAHVVRISAVGSEMILDIGPQTARQYARTLEDAQTIVLNGPMGVYEKPAYQNGTRIVGEAIARATAKGATTVVGGGDAAAAADELGFATQVSHVSTGGGATLEFLEGKMLPGIAALRLRSG